MNLDKLFVSSTLWSEYEELPATESHLIRFMLRTDTSHPVDPLTNLIYVPGYLGEPGEQAGRVLLFGEEEALANYLECRTSTRVSSMHAGAHGLGYSACYEIHRCAS